MPVLGSENSHGLWDKKKERNRISGVDARTYAKLEAKARTMATNGEKKKSCDEKVAKRR